MGIALRRRLIYSREKSQTSSLSSPSKPITQVMGAKWLMAKRAASRSREVPFDVNRVEPGDSLVDWFDLAKASTLIQWFSAEG